MMKEDSELPSEERMYSVLGLKKEDDSEEQERETTRAGSSSGWKEGDDGSATIPIFQHLPRKRLIFDRNNSVIKLNNLYHNMKEF
jgi:hypothetical protein